MLLRIWTKIFWMMQPFGFRRSIIKDYGYRTYVAQKNILTSKGVGIYTYMGPDLQKPTFADIQFLAFLCYMCSKLCYPII